MDGAVGSLIPRPDENGGEIYNSRIQRTYQAKPVNCLNGRRLIKLVPQNESSGPERNSWEGSI